MDSPEAKKIQELLQKKIKFVEVLLSYARQQSELSYINDPVSYDNIVESRGLLIEEIKKVDIVIQRSLNNLKESKGEIETRIKEVNDQITALLKQIIPLDEKSKALIVSELQTVKKKMQALQNGKKGIKGYDAGNNLNSAGIYTDSKR